MRKATFFILCIEGALLSFNVAACSALVPSIARDFGVQPFFAGRAVWLYMLSYGLAALVYGPLIRVFDARKIELIFFGLFSLANLYAGISPDITHLFIARFLMGAFGASVIPLILIMIASQAGKNERGKKVGVFFSATFIASLAGVFLSGIVHWRLIFIIPAALGFVLWLVMYRCMPSFRHAEGGSRVKYGAALKDRAVITLFAYIFCISFLYHGVQQWLSVFFDTRFGYSQFVISMLITLTSFSGIFGEVIGGASADSLGRLKTVNIGIACMIVSVFLLVIPLPMAACAAVMALWGLGWTFNHAGLSTMLTDLPKRLLNESASLNSSVRFVAGGAGAAAAGVLMRRSFESGFIVFGACLTVLLMFNRQLAVTTGERP